MLINFNHYFQAPPLQRSLSQAEIQALLMHLGQGRKVVAIQPLAGGFRNQNYQVTFENQQLAVLKVSKEVVSATKASTLQQQLSQFLPVPKILGERATSGHVFTLMEHLPGTLACELENNLPEVELQALGDAIGSLLRKVHNVQFTQPGSLDEHLHVNDPHPNLGDAWLAYMREVMHGRRAESRLGQEQCKAVLQLLNHYEADLHALHPTHCLVHSDFNLKNLLVQKKPSRWKISGLLDWEFAHVGSPLVDVGNFYRFEEALPPALLKGFAQGYGLEEIPQWRPLSLILDLAALCNFLDAPEDLPLTQETAVYLIRRTLERLSPTA